MTNASGSLPTGRRVRSVHRAVRILETLSQGPEGMSLSGLSNLLGIPKSTIHYILETLVEHDFVEKDERGWYRLGLGAYKVGSAYLRVHSLVGVFRQVARQIVADCREPVQLAVLDGREIVYIGKVEDGAAPVRLVSEVGQSLPAHTTALGKVLLAYLPRNEFDALFPVGSALPKMTSRSIASVSALRQQLRQVREQGQAHDFEETAEGLQCFGAPVFGSDGEVIAAMSVSVPSNRVDSQRAVDLVSLIRRGAAEVSRSLGCPPETLRAALATERPEAIS